MDYNIFIFFIALSIVLFIISRLTQTAWVGLSLGWIAGGLLIIIGYLIAKGETITSTSVLDSDLSVTTILSLGITSENMFIILALLGVVMIFSSSGDWI